MSDIGDEVVEDAYGEDEFDKDEDVKAVQSPVADVDEEQDEYSEDDEQQQFDELKAQIYGEPDEDDDYNEEFEEEDAPPETSYNREEEEEEEDVSDAMSYEKVVAAKVVARGSRHEPEADLKPEPPTTTPARKERIVKEVVAAKPPSKSKAVKGPAVKKKYTSSNRPKTTSSSKKTNLNVDEITQNYLSLLNNGKLASKTRLASAGGPRDTTSRPQSVHDSSLRRLAASSAMMDLAPLELRTTARDHDLDQPKPLTAMSKATLATTALNKIMSPAPGVYSSTIDRFGRQSVVFDDQGRPSSASPGLGFGTSRRPEHFVLNKDGSPGPVHLPRSEFDSTKQRPKTCTLGRRIEEYLPRNHSRWNPSPLAYPGSASLGVDGRYCNSRGTLAHGFTKGKKLGSSVDNPSGMVYISEGHSRIDNASIFSPSKFYEIYSSAALVRSTSPCHSMAPRYNYGGVFYKSPRLQSPGCPESQGGLQPTTNRGRKLWGSAPRASIGNAPRDYSPERSLNQQPFISKEHTFLSNKLLFSAPVGSYTPQETEHVTTPILSAGPPDRFYDRFEPGRVG